MPKNPIEDIQKLINSGVVSLDTIEAITGIRSDRIESVLYSPLAIRDRVGHLSDDEILCLSLLPSQLQAVSEVDDDERLAAVLDSLIQQFGFTVEGLVTLVAVAEGEIVRCLQRVPAIDPSERFRLGVRASYLLNVCVQGAAL